MRIIEIMLYKGRPTPIGSCRVNHLWKRGKTLKTGCWSAFIVLFLDSQTGGAHAQINTIIIHCFKYKYKAIRRKISNGWSVLYRSTVLPFPPLHFLTFPPKCIAIIIICFRYQWNHLYSEMPPTLTPFRFKTIRQLTIIIGQRLFTFLTAT